MKLDLRDVEFVAFRGGGPGGQHRNKHANCIRAIHGPTGIVVRATSERSLYQNKEAAIAELAARLARLEDDRIASARRQRHEAKPDAAFGHAIRTYRVCGNEQGVVDHRTGERGGIDVLRRGKLDGLIRAFLVACRGEFQEAV